MTMAGICKGGLLIALLLQSSQCWAMEGCVGSRRISAPVAYPLASATAMHAKQLDNIPNAANVLLIGDSHALLWPSEHWSSLSIVNTGIAGDLIEHVLWRLNALAWKKFAPSNVIVFLGSNNLARGDCAFDIIEALSVLSRRVHSVWPTARLFFVGIPPHGPSGSLRAAERKVINLLLRRRLSGDNVRYVDPDQLLDQLRPDRVHYVSNAYEALTSVIRARLQ